MNKKELLNHLKEYEALCINISNTLWENPELSGNEKKSADLFRNVLKEHDFTIVDVSNMEHAFYAEYGAGAPVIAILGEYDALAGLSQVCEAERKPIIPDAPGHGCGHNLLGSAALGAALAAKKLLTENNLSGTVRFYGCPEEEILSGKCKMINAHAFDGCDIALSWHPMSTNTVFETGFLANTSLRFYFKGITSHAAAAPHLGRSALDAVELMNVGANYLREHITEKARMHYTTNSGNFTPNIVPDQADSWYFVRAPHMKDVEEITNRLGKVAQGAALMTETQLEMKVLGGCYEMQPNMTLADLTYNNMTEIKPPQFSENDIALARDLQNSMDAGQIASESLNCGFEQLDTPLVLHESLMSKEQARKYSLTGSSDSGDVSYNMPMMLFTTACMPVGCQPHTWQATVSVGSGIGHKGMFYAAEIFTGLFYDLFTTPDLVSKAKEEFYKRAEHFTYKCLFD